MRVNHRLADIAVSSNSCTVRISYPSSSRCIAKNGVMNDKSPALLLSRRCEQPLARLFVPLIREDRACTFVRLRGQRSISSREIPMPSPSWPALGYFRSSALGNTTRPKFLDIILVLSFAIFEMLDEQLFDCRWKHRVTILISLSSAYGDLVLWEINIFYSERATFHEPKARTLKQRRDSVPLR